MEYEFELNEMEDFHLFIQSFSQQFHSEYHPQQIYHCNPSSNLHTPHIILDSKKKKPWSQDEKIKFTLFYVMEFLAKYEEKGYMEWNSKRENEFFLRMSKFIGSRTRDQCRSHHQQIASKQKKNLFEYLKNELLKWKLVNNECKSWLQSLKQVQGFQKKQREETAKQMKQLDQIHQFYDFD